ncbi:MAG TPA: hypothetical protein VJ417_15330, partial [Candidatus Glassbacteria bacterium]|nr:hypothetical protein [Candidatus Glassbacteria bacterium]
MLVACSDLERDNPYDPNTDALIVTLLSPADSTVVRLMTPVTFNVSAKTGFDNSPAGSFYWWRSNLAGLLATSAGFITDSLPAGRHRITVTVADSLNRRGSYSFTLTVLPLPEFGVMITAPPVDTVIIFGSAFTPEAREFVPADRSIIGREWKFGDGSGIPSSTAADPGTVSWDQPGNFQMIYRVVDDRGRVAADTVLVQVLAESSPPVAVILSPAADTTIVRDDSLFFEAFDEETAARIVSRRWLYPAGSGYEGITDDTSHIAGWRKFATPGVFDIIYRVNDLLGVVIDATVRITVNDTLPPPVALIIRPHARDSSLVAGDSVFFAGFLIPDVSSVTQSWDFGTGSGISSDSVKSPGWKVFNNTGSFKVVYQATDMSQRTARDSVNLTVSANQPPSAQIVQPAGNISIGTGVSYTFTAVDLDPEGRSLLRYWLWDPALGFTPSVADSARNAGSRTFGTAGTFRVSYHVVDDKGLHAADTLTVTVSANQAPAA